MPKIKFSLPLSCSDDYVNDLIAGHLDMLGFSDDQQMDFYDKYPGLHYLGFEYWMDFQLDTDTGQIVMTPPQEREWNLAE